jgi:hypothetical protein
MTDLTLYGTISMALLCGLLLALSAGLLFDHGDDSPNDGLILAMLRDQRSRQDQLRAWPTAPNARGEGVLIDTQEPGRHRALDAALAIPFAQRPSLARVGLNEALAWLATDRVKREAEHTAFKQLLSTSRFRSAAPGLLSGR